MAITPVTNSKASGQQTTTQTLQKQEEQLQKQLEQLQKSDPESPQIKVLQQRIASIEVQILTAEEQKTQSAVTSGGGKSGPPPSAPAGNAAGKGKVDIEA